MSTVGRMDGAFFVSRVELLSWVNSMFRLNLTKVEQCANGAVYCQIIDACHPGQVTMKKVCWSARADHDSIPNYKILQQAFDRVGIQRHVEVDRLIRGKYQDNLEMLQWIKTYFDRNFQGAEYDAPSRRFTDNPPEWAPRQPANGASGPANNGTTRQLTAAAAATRRVTAGAAVAGAGAYPQQTNAVANAPGGDKQYSAMMGANTLVVDEEQDRLREEVVDLKITVDGLETERDFYFQKLRDIEILCQALQANPDPNMTTSKFVEDVQRILYAKDDDDEG